ncbi:dTDP-4-dehydrorhamnose reductase [Streptomyces sp. NBC_01363]|uniref:dTDP-4-dehydrorhamnose reductase n=1 Tax=Streptomyces sp. NBC_01363 TaxID=2903840 RepID=UPI00225530BB|nr:dTDP-4-dehydrorhamnose reductase [Streptomyces sp. NBC_01363]MCX4733327.1 dTDP-4-dehydrorhamnose reductase [Streptomyces sp. NBC_01363]
MTRWLVTGASGMLGRDLTGVLRAAGEGPATTALGRKELDITDRSQVLDAVAGHDVVVNAAAWTDVDGAECDEAGAQAVNATAVRHLATACARHGARLPHVSTDYVFPGDGTVPWSETAAPDPVNAYGRSKLAGERAVRELLPAHGYTVRTAWLYGAHGANFVATMLRLAASREELDVVDDQTGQPTWSGALAARLVALGQSALAGDAPSGIYHGTATGRATWCTLAREAFVLAGLDPERIRAVCSERYPRPAPRPAWSVLGHEGWTRAGMAPLAPWRSMLASAFAEGVFPAARADGRPG